MRRIFFLILLLVSSHASATTRHSTDDGRIRDTNSVDGDFTLTGDIAFDCNTCPCLIYQEAETSDSQACGITVTSGNAYSQASVNTYGAALTLCGGAGSDKITVTDSTLSSGDTVEFNVDGTTTTLTEGVDFVCATETNDDCAISVSNSITANVLNVSSSYSGPVVYPVLDEGHCSTTITLADGGSNGVFATKTEGSNGRVLFSDEIKFKSDPGTGWIRYSQGSVGWYSNFAQVGFFYPYGFGVLPGYSMYTYGTNSHFGNATSYTSIGSKFTDTRSLTTSDVGTGGKLVVTDNLYADSAAEFASDVEYTGTGANALSSIITLPLNIADSPSAAPDHDNFPTGGGGPIQKWCMPATGTTYVSGRGGPQNLTYKAGTSSTIFLLWSPNNTDTGVAKMSFVYSAGIPGYPFATPVTTNFDLTGTGTTDQLVRTEIVVLPDSGLPDPTSLVVAFHLERQGSDAGDTFTGKICLDLIGLEFEMGQAGLKGGLP